ncbi:actin cortical patch SUR7/pH-response regulator pali [Penicillium angulare]|uniref:Actin cortical patch SUR7/pH-response regulator pali n=1 Tax=Penicillium angulare TaxID=116970 RepID=A0A9W9FIL0_9EURO|nr:actin cortical patch SUR7/pH-response regulator pali [Penicillium angulare]
MCSLALVTAAALGVTTMYGIFSHTITEVLDDLDGTARVGGSMLALLWMAMVLSLGAFSACLVRFFRRDF